ncbi:RHS repeat-associated core domain-containing protein [Pseudomonas sp. 3JA]|uniref:RHS repeat-associated core domain-containing protein n=1 Tax=Pseudomonas sp. 3JA TaxID=3109347 RepID=UPI00300A45AA
MQSQCETLLCGYHYDALDRLSDYVSMGKPDLQYFYRKKRLVTEIQGAIQYSIIQQGAQLLAQQRRQGDALSTTLLATDYQRSVLHALDPSDQQHSIAYSPYGHRLAESGLASLLAFNGERPDPVTGHYLLGNGYRAFNPVLMRFNSPDRFSPFGKGGLNPYAYCLGDPVNRNDPTGNSPLLFFWPGRRGSLTKIYLGDGFRTKAGVPSSLGKRSYSRFKQINEAAKELQIKLQRDLLVEDAKKLGLIESNKLYGASIRLDHLANRALPDNWNRSNAPINLQQKFTGPNYNLMQSASATERVHYRDLFEYLDAQPDNMKLSELLRHGVEGKGFDHKTVISYRERLELVTSKELVNLRKQALDLYNNYFER